LKLKTKTIMKAEIRIDEQSKMDVLFIDGKPQFCPYKSPIAIPSQLGNINIVNFPCTTQCPLFRVDENIVSLNCGCEKSIYHLESIRRMSKL
jgi:hypothetical protein